MCNVFGHRCLPGLDRHLDQAVPHPRTAPGSPSASFEAGGRGSLHLAERKPAYAVSEPAFHCCKTALDHFSLALTPCLLPRLRNGKRQLVGGCVGGMSETSRRDTVRGASGTPETETLTVMVASRIRPLVSLKLTVDPGAGTAYRSALCMSPRIVAQLDAIWGKNGPCVVVVDDPPHVVCLPPPFLSRRQFPRECAVAG